MQFDFLENEHEKTAFAFSVGVLVLTLLAILAFVFTGGSLIFYLFVALELGLGFYLIYHMSKAPAESKPARKQAAGKKAKR
jgi:4-hydroxybenzoate polyprenyltransferase